MDAVLLAAGYGSRLKPLTNNWPKCLMPVNNVPLLEHWINLLWRANICNVTVNTHYLSAHVNKFLDRPSYKNRIYRIHEDQLLGTCGTLRLLADRFKNADVLVAHADNWCHCDLSDFIKTHQLSGAPITMMTFVSDKPSSCGILEIDGDGLVQKMHEKTANPPGNVANGAVYIFKNEVFDWIKKHKTVVDISTELLPKFYGKIKTWENTEIHRDIGTFEELKRAQLDKKIDNFDQVDDEWARIFRDHPIHKLLNNDDH